MRYDTMLSLGAIAAAALMAVVGAGAAQATKTVLCEATESPCENPYPEGTAIQAKLKGEAHATLTAAGGFVEVTCKESTIEGETESVDTPEGHIQGLTFGNCDHTVKVLNPGGKLQIHHDAEHNGELTVLPDAQGETEVTVEAAGLDCIFGGTIQSGLTLTGGNPATVDATATIPKVGGSIFCPGSAVWHAEYEVTSPTPLYVGTTP
jgi:hypothetical protein